MVTSYVPHYRLTANGVFIGSGSTAPVEIFSTGIAVGVPDAGGGAISPVSQADQDGLVAPAKAFWEAVIAAACRPSVHLMDIKVAAIDANGRYAFDLPSMATSTVQGALNGGSDDDITLSAAVTWQVLPPTNKHSGRSFLPNPGINRGTDFRWDTTGGGTAILPTVADHIRTALSNLHNAVIDVDAGIRPIVSGVSTKIGTAPVNREIITAVMGDVPDHIRSRKDKLKVTYV